ncbi:DUF2927 domain-containing protein [Neogemmobacter tilapiae]|uniref:DUF2927 domain-containing protein n=1 Tax=Neogemmobacter tilapiae TaxID=875041 RepID=UPI001676DCC7|nr:DUF2927 domain-containing protein [Gemmobacter tilapiae]
MNQQILEILQSDRNTVRKWTFPPSIIVVHRGDPYRELVDAKFAEINAKVPGLPGELSATYFDLDQIEGSLFGQARYRIRDSRKTGEFPSVGRLYLGPRDTPQEVELTANIFIFLVGLEEGVLFGALTDSNLHEFSEGGVEACFYASKSKNNQMVVANIFIDVNRASDMLHACLHEELTHSLGLLNDSVNSPTFSYDNTVLDRPDLSPDFRLLRALYSAQVRPGDPPQKVADIYMELLLQDARQ